MQTIALSPTAQRWFEPRQRPVPEGFDLLDEFKQEYVRDEIPLEEFERKAAMYLRACGDDLMDPEPQGLDLVEIDAERQRLLPKWEFRQPISSQRHRKTTLRDGDMALAAIGRFYIGPTQT